MKDNFYEQQTSSMEDYLEAIAMINGDGKRATVTALSKKLMVKKPSVNWALKRLSDQGLVEHKKYRDVKLTPEGERVAEEIWHRHKILRKFLNDILDVNYETADNDACKIEHVLSSESLGRLESFIDFMLNSSENNKQWLAKIKNYIKSNITD
jgi:DtxR family transcriptional regulator, Mn-dependent transcriptional regulator